MRLLIAEDEKDLNRILVKRLKAEGYSVDACEDGEAALYYMENAKYDGAVLDITMPKMDGLTVVKNIRQKNLTTPVLFLTARDSIEDRISGLDIGANDYLVKPFAFGELLARIRVMTRKEAGIATSIYEVGDLHMDCAAHKVQRGGIEIKLSAKEFSILEHLMRNKDVVVSREQIEQHMWNFDYEGASNVVDVYIRYLRKKIDDAYEKKLIQTVRGVGYVLKEN